MMPGDLSDRIGESCHQARARLAGQPPEKGRAEYVCVPGDSVATDRVGPWNPSAVEQDHRAWHSADEVFVRPADVTGTAGHHDLHPRSLSGSETTPCRFAEHGHGIRDACPSRHRNSMRITARWAVGLLASRKPAAANVS